MSQEREDLACWSREVAVAELTRELFKKKCLGMCCDLYRLLCLGREKQFLSNLTGAFSGCAGRRCQGW